MEIIVHFEEELKVFSGKRLRSSNTISLLEGNLSIKQLNIFLEAMEFFCYRISRSSLSCNPPPAKLFSEKNGCSRLEDFMGFPQKSSKSFHRKLELFSHQSCCSSLKEICSRYVYDMWYLYFYYIFILGLFFIFHYKIFLRYNLQTIKYQYALSPSSPSTVSKDADSQCVCIRSFY